MFMPLSDSIGLSLADKGSFGAIMGRLKGMQTALTMAAGILVFVGFKTGFFSFTTPFKLIFLVAAGIFCVVFGLLLYMRRQINPVDGDGSNKLRFVFRKEYGRYYIITALFGAKKQIMYVYGPWVLIELLNFGADRMALLAIVGAGIGIFFMPAVGRWIDRFGTGSIMMIEAAVTIGIYVAYGFLSAGLSGGWLTVAGLAMAAAVAINIIDRMTMQFGMVRSVYMRSIALDYGDVTPTLSTGMAVDHVFSILSALLCGFLWREFGPQYVFVFAGFLSLCNMMIALRIKGSIQIKP